MTEALLDSLRFTPFPDAAPALAALRAAGLRLAIVSNWDCSLRAVLGELGLAGAVDTIVVSAEAGAPKPEAAIFLAALRQLRRLRRRLARNRRARRTRGRPARPALGAKRRQGVAGDG